MKFEYMPDIGFEIDSIEIKWGDERELVRGKLMNSHIESDHTIEVAQYFEPNTFQDLIVKRDIYNNYKSFDNSFFLNYDDNNRLESFEAHSGIDIQIEKFIIRLGEDISTVLTNLSKNGYIATEIEDGHFLFERSKFTIASAETMGGEGNRLYYFYASKDIEHLIT